MTFLHILFDTGTLDGFKGEGNHWWPPCVVIYSFPWCRRLWDCESNLLTILSFPLAPVLLVSIIIIAYLLRITAQNHCFQHYYLRITDAVTVKVGFDLVMTSSSSELDSDDGKNRRPYLHEV